VNDLVNETWKWRFLALYGAFRAWFSEAAPVHSAAEVDGSEAFVSVFFPGGHALFAAKGDFALFFLALIGAWPRERTISSAQRTATLL
jgi:hypothetical protein